MLRPGQRVDRYEVEALIGQGGLAEVYRVRHVELGSLHALKLLIWTRPSLAQRFILEGRIQAQLRHPNLVTVTDLIRHEGQFGLLMEFVENLTLESYLKQRGSLPVDEALALFAPILAGVVAAHDLGVLHRDLKPANILLAKVPAGLVPKVTDFGIAKVVRDDLQSTGTDTGVAMGTPGYLAPEQVLDSADADARADVFALGAILYEMLTGRRAFADDEGEVVVRSTLLREPSPLRDTLPAFPEHVADTVMQALSRERDVRPADVRELARGLYQDRPELLAQVEGQQTTKALALDADVPTLEPEGTPVPRSSRALVSEPVSVSEHLEAVQPEGPVEVARVTTLEPDVSEDPRIWWYVGVAVAVLAVLAIAVVAGLMFGGLPTAPAPTGAAPVDVAAPELPPPPVEEPAPPAGLAGTWQGRAGGLPLELVLNEHRGAVEGTLTLSADDGGLLVYALTGQVSGGAFDLERGTTRLRGQLGPEGLSGELQLDDEAHTWSATRQ